MEEEEEGKEATTESTSRCAQKRASVQRTMREGDRKKEARQEGEKRGSLIHEVKKSAWRSKRLRIEAYQRANGWMGEREFLRYAREAKKMSLVLCANHRAKIMADEGQEGGRGGVGEEEERTSKEIKKQEGKT